ncbi:asparagine synthase-related protein [Aliiglaciecola sp. 2_MG-2023]|uniref:asparagine synthetase B family protein n=1 Tax=unclassified Aliiglaciecola TaxID=2593648 RepID=UPI0026E42654|nr:MULTISPECIES: asparagine synthase-related protein [unclassified Aliiglaciecola]MDO6709188.1 asparagine synthase-related protein [Aliiglaciecola sp. 2_MG-2023]MDO6750336.1 asparagine synthase-related protein [Aliiglaciecola sp. 1_MG-2023]
MWLTFEMNGQKAVNISKNQQLHCANNDSAALCLCGYVFLDGAATDVNELFSLFKNEANIASIYQRLSGQFWMLYFDQQQAPILFNDQMGTKNCYYYENDSALYFSGNLRDIKSHDDTVLKVSKQALYNYVYFHCIPSPTSIYENTFKLEPGKAVIFDKQSGTHTQLLYSPVFASSLDNQDKAQIDCLAIIEECVKKADFGNVGAFLSGGLDSSTVAGMLAKTSERAKTFSIGFKVAGYDETEYALITANHFGTEHEVLYLEPQEVAEEFVTVAQYFDEPFGNSSAMAAFFCAKFAKNKGVEVLLAGDGGDELFAGNERYAKQKVFELYNKLPAPVGGALNAAVNNAVGRKLPVLKKGASYLEQARVPLPGRLQTHNFVNQMGAKDIFPSNFLDDVDQQIPIQQLNQRYAECKSSHPVDQMLFLDWKNTLADNDLIKVTKMCELAGVEVRFPLLDKKLIDFSCEIPADVKLPGGELRDFYKKTCNGFLPDETLSKSKHGFGLPFGVWMKENQQLKDITIDALNNFKHRNIVNSSLIDQALDSHNTVHTGYYGELIWIMVVLELWLQKEEPDFRV